MADKKVFHWCATQGISVEQTHNNTVAQFGDGYKQVVSHGINNIGQRWEVSFRGRKKLIEQILAFLDEHGGVLAFWWRSPFDKEQQLYRAAPVKLMQLSGNVWELSTTFERVFMYAN